MPIPKSQDITLPLLKFASEGKEHHIREAIDHLADVLGLSEEELKELLPSGHDVIFGNRVKWALKYMREACILESTRRGFFHITQRGKEVLKQNPDGINVKFLDQFPEFIAFRKRSRKPETAQSAIDISELDIPPTEAIEEAYQKIRNHLAGDLLDRVMNCSPSFFERLVVQLLVRMGYGGSIKDAGEAIGRMGDEGIDGIIKEDRLGLESIYIQAKRWQAPIGRPDVQRFVGALQGQRARKGVFITTSTFTSDAREYASRIDTKVVLIDGAELARFMIDYDLGVSKAEIYEVKRVDSDFFGEE